MAFHQLTITARGRTRAELTADAVRQVAAYLASEPDADVHALAHRAVNEAVTIDVTPDHDSSSLADVAAGTPVYAGTLTVTIR